MQLEGALAIVDQRVSAVGEETLAVLCLSVLVIAIPQLCYLKPKRGHCRRASEPTLQRHRLALTWSDAVKRIDQSRCTTHTKTACHSIEACEIALLYICYLSNEHTVDLDAFEGRLNDSAAFGLSSAEIVAGNASVNALVVFIGQIDNQARRACIDECRHAFTSA